MAVTFITFVSGDPEMVDHTPTGALSAGDVIVTTDGTFICHLDIAADALGAVGANGGVYRAPVTSGSGTDMDIGDKLYWDATNNVASPSASGNKPLGFVVKNGVAGDTTVDFVHAFF